MIVLIILPFALHIGFDGIFLSENVTIGIPVVGFLLFIMSLSNYLACAFTEPGFLPRSLPSETINVEKENNIVTDSGGFYYPLPKTKYLEIKDCYYEVKFCVRI